jgi:competence ComEA-like helix-hairpin-helix protein
MLTTAEKQSLVLTLSFLLVGGGLKVWRQAEVRLGPFQGHSASAVATGKESVSSGNPYDSLHHHPEPEPSPESPPEDSLWKTPGVGSGQPQPPGEPELQDGRRLADPGSSDAGGTLAGAERMPEAAGSGTAGPQRTSGRKKPPAGKVALDRATAADLARVPGIGPKTAQAIVEYRAAHGPIRDLRDLLNVKGIGEKKLERIRSCLVLSPEGRSE